MGPMDLSTLIAGPLGGVLGFAGSLAQKWLGMKEAKQNHEFKMAEMELASKVDLQKADIMFRSTVEEKSGEAFSAAIEAQGKLQAASPWAQNILALFRPGLTCALWLSSLILSILYRNSNPQLMEYIVTATFSMFTISGGFWFGTRSQEKMDIRKAVK